MSSYINPGVEINIPAGASTEAKQDDTLMALGTPAQAGEAAAAGKVDRA